MATPKTTQRDTTSRKSAKSKNVACLTITNPDTIKAGKAEFLHLGLTDNQRRFLTAFSRTGNLSAAAELANLSRQPHYSWLAESLDYRQAFEIAKEIGIEGLEAEARRRAMSGSDVLLIFLLRSMRPEKYRDNHKVIVNAEPPKPNVTDMTDDEKFDKLRQLAERVRQRRLAQATNDGRVAITAELPGADLANGDRFTPAHGEGVDFERLQASEGE